MTDRYPYYGSKYKGSRGYVPKSTKPTLSADRQHGYWWHRSRYLKTGNPGELAAMLARDLPDLPDRYTCCGGLVLANHSGIPAGHRDDCPRMAPGLYRPNPGRPGAMRRALDGAAGRSACFMVALYLLVGVGVIALLLGLAS